MIISVINHTHDQITDSDLHAAIRAINRQIAEDFEPYWSLGAQLRLEGKSTMKPTKQTLADMRGDAVLYMWDVLVAPYKEKEAPVVLLRYWTKGEHGTWKMSDQCELGNDGQ